MRGWAGLHPRGGALLAAFFGAAMVAFGCVAQPGASEQSVLCPGSDLRTRMPVAVVKDLHISSEVPCSQGAIAFQVLRIPVAEVSGTIGASIQGPPPRESDYEYIPTASLTYSERYAVSWMRGRWIRLDPDRPSAYASCQAVCSLVMVIDRDIVRVTWPSQLGLRYVGSIALNTTSVMRMTSDAG